MKDNDNTLIGRGADLKEALRRTVGPIGEPFIAQQQPIVLSIGNQKLTVQLRDIITVGRNSDADTGWPPDVDLSTFDAKNQGVSRRHIQITRKNGLIFVADLGSTNGTRLNGQEVLPNSERLLRSGDALQLGFLKLRVSFGPLARHAENRNAP